MTSTAATALGLKENLFEMRPEQVVAATITRTLPAAKILALLHAVEKKIKSEDTAPALLFVSPHRNAGADIIAFETAYASALAGKKVLFIDTKHSASNTIRQFRDKVQLPLNIPSKGGVAGIAPVVNLKGTSLFFATFDEYHEQHASFPDRKAHQKIIDGLREVFDLIVAYSESGLSNPLTTILSGLADASIIVVEEGRTRIPIIKELHRLVDMHGGNVAGVVMNKCQLHIPPLIYGSLF